VSAREAVASVPRTRSRQICCLGLPGELLMASLLPALRELVPSDSAAFFWVRLARRR
jgi:hypothetical protein